MEHYFDLLLYILLFAPFFVIIANTISAVNESTSGAYVKLKISIILFSLAQALCLIFAYIAYKIDFPYLAVGAIFLGIAITGPIIIRFKRIKVIKKAIKTSIASCG